MTDAIVRPRQWWKTTELVKISAETWKYIVCLDRQRLQNIVKVAEGLKLSIPFPITLDEIKKGGLNGGSVGRDWVIVDDYDIIVKYIVNDAFRWIERKVVSLTDNKITPDMTEINSAVEEWKEILRQKLLTSIKEMKDSPERPDFVSWESLDMIEKLIHSTK